MLLLLATGACRAATAAVGQVDDTKLHFHPVEPRSARVTLRLSF